MEAAKFLLGLATSKYAIIASEIMMGIMLTQPLKIYIGDKFQIAASDTLQKIVKEYWNPFIYDMHKYIHAIGWMPYAITEEEDINDMVPTSIDLEYGKLVSLYNTKKKKKKWYWQWNDNHISKNKSNQTTNKKPNHFAYDPDVKIFMVYEPRSTNTKMDCIPKMLYSENKEDLFSQSQYTSPWADHIKEYRFNTLMKESQLDIERNKTNGQVYVETVIPWNPEQFDNLMALYKTEDDKKKMRVGEEEAFSIKQHQISSMNKATINNNVLNEIDIVNKRIDKEMGILNSGGTLKRNIEPEDHDEDMDEINIQPLMYKKDQYSQQQINTMLSAAKHDSKGLFDKPYKIAGTNMFMLSPIHRVKFKPTPSGRSDIKELNQMYKVSTYEIYGIPETTSMGGKALNQDQVKDNEEKLDNNVKTYTERYETLLKKVYLLIYGERLLDFKTNVLESGKRVLELVMRKKIKDTEKESDTNVGDLKKQFKDINDNNDNGVKKNKKKDKDSKKKDDNKLFGKLVQNTLVNVKLKKNNLNEARVLLNDQLVGEITREINVTVQFQPKSVYSLDSLISLAEKGVMTQLELRQMIKQKLNTVEFDVNNWGEGEDKLESDKKIHGPNESDKNKNDIIDDLEKPKNVKKRSRDNNNDDEAKRKNKKKKSNNDDGGDNNDKGGDGDKNDDKNDKEDKKDKKKKKKAKKTKNDISNKKK